MAGHRIGVAQLIARALSLVPPDSPEAGLLLSRYGRVVGIEESNYHGAQSAFDRASDIARREEDASLEVWTLVSASHVDHYHLRLQESLEKGLRSIELARRADDVHAEVQARYFAVLSLIVAGDIEGVRLHAAACLEAAERLRDRNWLALALWTNDIVSRLEGDWPDAQAFSDRSLAVAPRDPRLFHTQIPMEYERGDFARGEELLETLLKSVHLTGLGPTAEVADIAFLPPLVARITGIANRFDVAAAAAESVLSSEAATPLMGRIARAGLALMAVQRSDAVETREHYAALEPARGTMVPVSICVDRLLGLLCVTLDKPDQAMAHFEDAIAFCRKAGYRPELAWVCHDYADALLQRSHSVRGDPVEPRPSTSSVRSASEDRTAVSLLDESLAISRELGMRPLMERGTSPEVRAPGHLLYRHQDLHRHYRRSGRE